MKIMRRHRGAIVILFVLQLLCACASKQSYNEGTTRVGYFKPIEAKPVGVFIAASDSKSDIIAPQDAFSIRLLSAYICDFREDRSWGDRLTSSNKNTDDRPDKPIPCKGGDGNQEQNTRGEIAIVANLGERKESIGLSFDPNEIKKSGRVIYYNEDVRETGQLINALNLPVYGPKTYSGDSFFMDWSILELDTEESSAARATIKRLAELGGLAYPPGAPILNVLNNIGSAMLANNGDDVEMRFQMEFDPYVACSNLGCPKFPTVHRNQLREGYFALLRGELRGTLPPMESLTVCKDSGMLCSGKVPYREGSWLLLRISREDPARAKGQDATSSLSILLDALGKADQPDIEGVKKAIEEALRPTK